MYVIPYMWILPSERTFCILLIKDKGCGEASCDSLFSAPIQGYMFGILSACISADSWHIHRVFDEEEWWYFILAECTIIHVGGLSLHTADKLLVLREQSIYITKNMPRILVMDSWKFFFVSRFFLPPLLPMWLVAQNSWKLVIYFAFFLLQVDVTNCK